MNNTEKDLKDALRNCLSALTKVQKNQEYQSRHGSPYFTSAPTEMEWKEESQKATDEMVEKAIYKATITLIG